MSSSDSLSSPLLHPMTGHLYRLQSAIIGLAVVSTVLFASTVTLGGVLGQMRSQMPTASPFASRQQLTLSPVNGNVSGSANLSYDVDEGWASLVAYDSTGNLAGQFLFDYNARNTYVSTTGGVCTLVVTPDALTLPDLRAVKVQPAGVQTVQDRVCNLFKAERFDRSIFEYSVDSQGQFCSVNFDGRIVYEVTRSLVGSAVVRPSIPRCSKTVTEEDFRLSLGRSCSICEDVANGVISIGTSVGCGLLSGGLAATICGILVSTACHIASCAQWACQRLGYC